MSNIENKYDLFNNVLHKSVTVDAENDIAFINKNSKNSVVFKGDGSNSNANGYYAQYKNDQESGIATELSLHSNTITVQKDLVADDIAINYHKLNAQLYELTNMKEVMGTAVGNLTMMGTVLVKTYEPTLKKWVLMRRQVRMPIFSNLLDTAIIDDKLELDVAETYKELLEYKIENKKYSDSTNK